MLETVWQPPEATVESWALQGVTICLGNRQQLHMGKESRTMKGQSLFRRLGFALAGLRWALLREASFRTHLLAAAVVLATLVAVRPSAAWWAIGLMAVGMVLVAELINSALETLADRLHPEQHPEIRIAKDLAAAAVLVASVIALIVAAIFVLR
ncbi:MAG TPA: diacylglycerol kinase [Steroidobacteraceae bacterium]|nr:diacylglycerol kinase [Steroidobacteraceae bacterium]